MYYVSHLGVSASARGKGLGSAMIRHIVARAREEGVPVCLLTMTEKNVSASCESRGDEGRAGRLWRDGSGNEGSRGLSEERASCDRRSREGPNPD